MKMVPSVRVVRYARRSSPEAQLSSTAAKGSSPAISTMK